MGSNPIGGTIDLKIIIMEKENTDLMFNAAKTIYEYHGTDEKCKAELVKMFPELEPEDEKFARIVLDSPFKHEADYKFVKAYLEKQKEQKPTEWSEEDKEIMHDIIKYHYDQGEISSKHNKWASWLEHKYFSLQSNWKPSENKDVYEIAYERYPINNRLVREVTKDINEDTRDGFIDGYNYCNSTHWKPSEEQMKALEDAFRKDGGNEYRKVINSLYCDLQKLL